jgi:phage head maturation protease
VNFEATVPRCDIGDRALEMVRSGVYTGCSFEFLPGERDVDWYVEERGAGKEVRVVHKRFKRISAFTLGMDPAYSQTSCNAREMWDMTPTAKREAEEAAAAKRAEEEREREQQERERQLMREREKAESMRLARERELELMEY